MKKVCLKWISHFWHTFFFVSHRFLTSSKTEQVSKSV